MTTPIDPFRAVQRFGLGRRGAEALPSDPQAWLAAQTTGPDPAANALAGLPSAAEGLGLIYEQRKLRQTGVKLVEPVFAADADTQMDTLLDSTTPFRERLVAFWANHFTVSTRQGDTRALVGPYVREAIRPYVTARFADMLFAVMRHPAMLRYLDNESSIGPQSRAGLRSGRGLNENLARECLELHTLGSDGGYSQADVTSFAAILTGWSVARPGEIESSRNGFVFRPNAHQPGDKTLLGRVFGEGEDGGIEALSMLSTHPATYRHLARQMTAHFIADTPTPQAVARVQAALADTQGDLGAAARVLIGLPDAGAPEGRKLRTPLIYAAAAMRTLDLPQAHRPRLRGALYQLGEPLWEARLPNGWSDRSVDWAAPDALLRRVDWAYALAGQGAKADPMDIAQTALGPHLHPATLEAIRHAGDRRDGLTLLYASPEFLRC